MPDWSMVTAAAEISYRQLDYWTRRGYLRPDVPDPGSGAIQTWSREECDVARLMQRLIHAGLSVSKSARVARAAVYAPSTGRVRARIAPGIWVTIEGDPL
jgi:DNA-binding transcriptional MerR regulator